jgi:hypothetical protein
MCNNKAKEGCVIYMHLDERQQEDLKIISNPEEWFHNVVLPLKNLTNRQPGEMPQSAFLVRGQGSKLYLKNIWALETGPLLPQLVDVPVLEFESFEAILKAGWEVD